MAVEQGDAGAANASSRSSAIISQQGVAVEGLDHRTVGGEPLGTPTTISGQRRGLFDMESEEIRPLLAADLEQILEAGGDEVGRRAHRAARAERWCRWSWRAAWRPAAACPPTGCR